MTNSMKSLIHDTHSTIIDGEILLKISSNLLENPEMFPLYCMYVDMFYNHTSVLAVTKGLMYEQTISVYTVDL